MKLAYVVLKLGSRLISSEAGATNAQLSLLYSISSLSNSICCTESNEDMFLASSIVVFVLAFLPLKWRLAERELTRCYFKCSCYVEGYSTSTRSKFT